MKEATVLYDAPGPRARRRNRLLALLFAIAFAAAGWVVLALGQKDQWAAQKWKPFLQGDIWTAQIIPGLIGTLKAAAIAAVLAMASAIVIACVYIPINLTLAWAATRLERRNRRRQITATPEEP